MPQPPEVWQLFQKSGRPALAVARSATALLQDREFLPRVHQAFNHLFRPFCSQSDKTHVGETLTGPAVTFTSTPTSTYTTSTERVPLTRVSNKEQCVLFLVEMVGNRQFLSKIPA